MTEKQKEYIITEDKLRQLEMRFIYHNMEKSEPDVFTARSEFMKDARSRPYDPSIPKPHTVAPGATIFISTDGWRVCRVGQGTECDLFKDDVYVCTTPDESIAFRIKTAMRGEEI